MEESTCHEMVVHLSQRCSSMLCLFIFINFFFFLGGGHFFISFKYDFNVDAERMTVKTR